MISTWIYTISTGRKEMEDLEREYISRKRITDLGKRRPLKGDIALQNILRAIPSDTDKSGLIPPNPSIEFMDIITHGNRSRAPRFNLSPLFPSNDVLMGIWIVS